MSTSTLSPKSSAVQPPPTEILRFLHSSWIIQVIKTAMELRIFDTMTSGPQTPDQVAQKVQAQPQGVKLLLDALAGINFIQKEGSTYQLNELSRIYLTTDSDLCLQNYMSMDAGILGQAWNQLTQVIKTGNPLTMVNQPEEAARFFPNLATAIFPFNFTTAHSAAVELKASQWPAGSKILDVAAGSGVWSLPFAQQNPQIQVDALDFPETLEVTRRFAEQYQVEKQYNYMATDWQSANLPDNHYDMVILGHICHSEGWDETVTMLRKMAKTVKPGGQILIAEFFANTDRTGPVMPLLFALNMYLVTEKGCVFSDTEMQRLLTEAGFNTPVRMSLPYLEAQTPLMVAKKA